MSCLELINELQSAKATRKSGKILVIGSIDGVSKGVNIDIHQGKITRINLGTKSGNPVVDIIVNMKSERVRFLESETVSSSPEPDTPDLQTLLDRIAELDNSADTKQLVETIIKSLEKVMGESSRELVKDIADKFPPEDNEQKFRDACKEMATDIIGRKQADRLFEGV